MATNNNKANANSTWSKGAPAQRSTTTETTTTEIISRPGNSSGRNSRSGNQRRSANRGNGARNGGSSKRAWEIRPHEAKYALPGPGSAVNTNDEAWYIGKLRDQAERYGALPWTAISGDELGANDFAGVINYGSTADQLTLTSVSRNFPSVMVAGLIPALGNTSTVPTRLDMPWMITAEQKIAFLQSKISGSLPFHAADLVCYWFAAADIFAEIAQAERALKIARTWMTFENVSYPKQLCAAVGWNFDSIMGNVRIFEGQIQEIINLANTLLLPKDLALVERWYFLYSHVFKDSNLPTAKLYAYRKDGYYTFEEQLYDTGTALKFVAAPCCKNGYPGNDQVVGFWTPTTWFESMMARISKLLPGRSTAVVDIMAKLLRAYDVSTFFAYPNVSTDGIEPKFDPEALTAFANMTMTGMVYYNIKDGTAECFNMQQNQNTLTLTYHSSVFRPAIFVPTSNVLRAWEAKPSVGSLFEMTRLVCCEDGNPQLSSGFMYTGTEIVNSVEIYSGAGDTIDDRHNIVSRVRTVFAADTEGDDAWQTWRSSMETMNLWQRFEYAPIAGITARAGSSLVNGTVSLVADMDNYAVLKSHVLQRIHRLAVANLWGVQTDFIG